MAQTTGQTARLTLEQTSTLTDVLGRHFDLSVAEDRALIDYYRFHYGTAIALHQAKSNREFLSILGYSNVRQLPSRMHRLVEDRTWVKARISRLNRIRRSAPDERDGDFTDDSVWASTLTHLDELIEEMGESDLLVGDPGLDEAREASSEVDLVFGAGTDFEYVCDCFVDAVDGAQAALLRALRQVERWLAMLADDRQRLSA
ncbi:hypothetical protein [Brevibacterium sp. SMBL_HHYL_HB1]|uniref:hypothetical protein n=1 Tax=Brevibacterium sp. SMBL_HHYL_HB1 TaxID=2777556 RepID=UPI001BAACBFB|nr:hypothetical protein [Brevibacterium sp. SMBL_HHYL_HB1]QUL80633.1 hypothetical protein IG171_07710 [Brevibacterium sp. SMBL_HHYL_HB1]